MGMLKRILRETSHKILHKLAGPRSSRRLVLNSDGSPLAASSGQLTCKTPVKTRRRAKKIARASAGGDSSALPQALLVAAKNHLPPVQFHHVHGPNALLSKNKCVARRTQSFCHALVFSNRIILPNERVYIKVLEIAKGWSGTIRFGFTSVDPATLRYQMPKHACPDMTNDGHTWARALADEVVRRNSVIHFSYNTNGYIHYGINNQDCGVFYANVNTSQHLWFIVDIYGLTAAVELIDPRIHNHHHRGSSSTSELDLSRWDCDEGDESVFNGASSNRSTMFKSTSAMDQVATQFGVRSKRKRSRKTPRHSTLVYGQWPSENFLPITALGQQQVGGAMLPNLSSIILPPAQQNIYSPMPSLSRPPPPVANNLNDSHDYYQIMTQNTRQPRAQTRGSRIPSSVANHASYVSSRSASALNSSSTTNSSHQALNRIGADEEEEISHQLENSLQMSDEIRHRHNHQQQQQVSAKSTKSTAGAAANGEVQRMPVAAIRKRLQNNSLQTSSKREANPKKDIANMRSGASASSSSSKALSGGAASNSVKPSARHSSKVHKTPNIRDISNSSSNNNNSNPPSKDCPICFERPINCVLYQCGHMCTCYECGVKQWRTQSRTCPICRTIIKDVIKTYMS